MAFKRIGKPIPSGRLKQSGARKMARGGRPRKMRRGGRGGRSCSPNQLQNIGLFCEAVMEYSPGMPEAQQNCNLFNFCEWISDDGWWPGVGYCQESGDYPNTGYFNCSQFNEAQCQVASNMVGTGSGAGSPCSQSPYYSEI